MRRAFLTGLLTLFCGGLFHKFGGRKRHLVGLLIDSVRYRGRAAAGGQRSDVFLAKNGSPQQNVKKVIEMMGGIETFIGANDIVLLKPNCQWWNQGRTNLAAMKGFIDLVLEVPGFSGEIIIAENQHFMDDSLPEERRDDIRGWTHLSEINGDIDGVNHNVNTLIEQYHTLGHGNVNKVHWRDGGPKVADAWGSGQNGGLVESPAQGDGYVWSDIEYTFSPIVGAKWKVKMSYPIFTSPYSGITIDFKEGAFLRDGQGGGKYMQDRPLKFINFAALNDHGSDTGITSAVKNYMGITDLSCGVFGVNPQGYNNVHTCGGRYFRHAKAGPLGHFMKTIRRADLNITTAEWIGWGDRTDITKAAQTKTILASTDPVALDYYGARYLILPHSRDKRHHDPDNPRSSIRNFLQLAAASSDRGLLHASQIRVQTHDFESKSADSSRAQT